MIRIVLAAVLLASAATAMAGFPVSRQMTCPIGGERFDFVTTASYTTFGARPDGKPFGSWTFPLGLPECPGNGLIVYKEFDAGELRRLEALIASEDYRALRAGDVQYYRFAWLLREMGAPANEHIWALAQAGWQAEVGSPLRARYLTELAERTAALAGEPTDRAGFAMRARWINALRELGRFDEALALVGRTDLAPLRAGDRSDRSERQNWIDHYAMLRTLVARRDMSADPIDFMGPNRAASLCLDEEAALDERQRAFCASDAMREPMAQARRDRAGAEDAIADLERAADEMERRAREADRPRND